MTEQEDRGPGDGGAEDPSTPESAPPPVAALAPAVSSPGLSSPYTVYEDTDRPGPVPETEPADPVARRPGPDPIALVVGLASLGVAVLAMTGVLAALDPRWMLAAGALAVGALVLLASLRRSRTARGT